MPDEKIAELVSEVNFGTLETRWMRQMETCFHQVLTYEYYLKKVPDNLALPKFRKLMIRIVYRLFCQVHPSRFEFSKSIQHPDPILLRFVHFLIESEFRRKQTIIEKNPPTSKGIRRSLQILKREMEI